MNDAGWIDHGTVYFIDFSKLREALMNDEKENPGKPNPMLAALDAKIAEQEKRLEEKPEPEPKPETKPAVAQPQALPSRPSVAPPVRVGEIFAVQPAQWKIKGSNGKGMMLVNGCELAWKGMRWQIVYAEPPSDDFPGGKIGLVAVGLTEAYAKKVAAAKAAGGRTDA